MHRARYHQRYSPAYLSTCLLFVYPAASQRGSGWNCWYGSDIGVGTGMGDGMVAGPETAV